MIKLVKFLLGAVFVLIFVSVAGYIFIAHPNDARLDPLVLDGLQALDLRYERVASLLRNQLPHTLDISDAAFLEKKSELFRALPEAAQPDSLRFRSRFQVYVPVGRYPTRLEAMDAIFIPSGATLRVRPQISGRFQMRFSWVAAKTRANLTVRQGEKNLLDEAHLGGLEAEARRGLLGQMDAVLNVERRKELAHWQAERVDLELTKAAELSFRCAEGSLGCLVGDVSFLKAATQPARNVIVVLVDTMRGDALRGGHAPALAAFANEAVSFTKAVSPGNMTSPSTNALLSCQRPTDLGSVAFAYAVDQKARSAFYKAQKPSFPAVFGDAGYQTAMIGNVSVISEIYGVGVHHGFDEQVSIEVEAYDTPQIAAEAVRWLRQNADRPFFLYLHFNGPHAPYRAPWRDIIATYPGLGAFGSYPGVLKWLYQSEIHYTDRYMGEVFSAVRQLGLWDETTIALTADHGDQHMEHHFRGNTVGPDFAGAYFDHGATLLQDEITVPLVIKRAGQRSGVSLAGHQPTLSLGPTLLGLAGLPVPAYCQAPSWASELAAGVAPKTPAIFGSEGFRGRAIYFEERYKYVRTYEPTDKRVYPARSYGGTKRLYLDPEELYDLTTDPEEAEDLAKNDPALLSRARQLYRDYYQIKDAYELVVEVPGQDSYDVSFSPGTEVQSYDGQVELSTGAAPGAKGHGPARLIFLVRRFGDKLPSVHVADHAIALRSTSLRLPIAMPPEGLPEELGGPYTLLPERKSAMAYLRRVQNDGQLNRRIVTGNAQFEKVLREWGYLND